MKNDTSTMLEKLILEFNLFEEWKIDEVRTYTGCRILVQFIEPHEGTDWKYCIRAEHSEEFDRWSVVQFEEFFESDDGFELVFELLKQFQNGEY